MSLSASHETRGAFTRDRRIYSGSVLGLAVAFCVPSMFDSSGAPLQPDGGEQVAKRGASLKSSRIAAGKVSVYQTSGPLKSCGSSATSPALCLDNDRGHDCPLPPSMTRFCDKFETNRRSHQPSRFATWAFDDWAWRKGQDYGTILVNLDLHQVVDLLPDRAAESFST
jgi:hypothetical protein